MPRLSTWMVGATVAGGAYLYALPTLNDEVHRYVESRESSVLAGEHARHREQALRVHQLYAALVRTIDNARALSSLAEHAPAGDPASPATVWLSDGTSRLRASDQQASQSVLKTNKDVLLFYCDVQRLRSLLLRVPARAQTAEEALRLWRAADAMEKAQCGPTTWLHFRDRPLRWGEWARCLYSFVCYWLCFRLVPFVWCHDSAQRRRMLHAVATHIMCTLEVECEMTVGSSHTVLADEPRRRDTDNAEEASTLTDDGTLTVLLNAQHWVEEVGFWACPGNPLLQRPDTSATSTSSSPSTASPPHLTLFTGRTDLRRCLDAWWDRHDERLGAAVSPWVLITHARPSRTAVAESIPYEQHWRRFLLPRSQARRAHTTPPTTSSTITTTDALGQAILARPITTTLGYPLLSDVAVVRRRLHAREQDTEVGHEGDVTQTDGGRHEPLVVPVGLAGLPRLLYVNALTAVPDVAPRRTKNQMYDYVYREQYKRDPARAGREDERGTLSRDADARAAGRLTREEEVTFHTLYSARVHGGFPWWSPLWWGRVYGGRSERGSRTRRVLRYHIGSPCVLDGYDLAQLDATVKATAEAYGE